MELSILLKRPEVNVCAGGKGFELRFPDKPVYNVYATFGNVSVAFDQRNYARHDDAEDCGVSLEFGAYDDDPVRLNDERVDDGDSPAEKLLFALAADLGYDLISQKG